MVLKYLFFQKHFRRSDISHSILRFPCITIFRSQPCRPEQIPCSVLPQTERLLESSRNGVCSDFLLSRMFHLLVRGVKDHASTRNGVPRLNAHLDAMMRHPILGQLS